MAIFAISTPIEAFCVAKTIEAPKIPRVFKPIEYSVRMLLLHYYRFFNRLPWIFS